MEAAPLRRKIPSVFISKEMVGVGRDRTAKKGQEYSEERKRREEGKNRIIVAYGSVLHIAGTTPQSEECHIHYVPLSVQPQARIQRVALGVQLRSSCQGQSQDSGLQIEKEKEKKKRKEKEERGKRR